MSDSIVIRCQSESAMPKLQTMWMSDSIVIRCLSESAMPKLQTMWEDGDTIQENYFRLVAFVVDLVMSILRPVIKYKIGNMKFEDFLDNNKHKIYHMWINDTPCCQCHPGSTKYLKKKELSKEQISCLFKIDDHTTPRHHKQRDGKTTQHCICKISTKVGSTEEELDIALACTILQNCTRTKCNPLELKCIEKIKKLRNKISHVTSTKSLPTNEFNEIWAKLEYSILYLANGVSKDLHQEANKLIISLKSRDLEMKYCLKVDNTLRLWEIRDVSLKNHLETILCAQQQHSVLLEGHTSKFDDHFKTIQNDVKSIQNDINEIRQTIRERGCQWEHENKLVEQIRSLQCEISVNMNKLEKKVIKTNRRFARNASEKQYPVSTCQVTTNTNAAFHEKYMTECCKKEDNHAKLTLIIIQLFTHTLQKAFKSEWERQNPNFPWVVDSVSCNKLLDIERRPSKRGKLCKEQIRSRGDINEWDFNLLADSLCYLKAFDLKKRNAPLYNGVHSMIKLRKDFARLKNFKVENKMFDDLIQRIELCLGTVPEFRIGLSMLTELKSIVVCRHQTIKHNQNYPQFKPKIWSSSKFVWVTLMLICFVVLLVLSSHQDLKTKVEELQKITSDFQKVETTSCQQFIPVFMLFFLCGVVSCCLFQNIIYKYINRT